MASKMITSSAMSNHFFLANNHSLSTFVPTNLRVNRNLATLNLLNHSIEVQEKRIGRLIGLQKRCVAELTTSAPPTEKASTRSSTTPALTPATWTWQHEGRPIRVPHVSHSGSSTSPSMSTPVVFLPAYSDVSTVEEWEDVAASLVSSDPSRQVVVSDWPGFGGSDSPPLDYTADLMEKFLVDFFSAKDGPLGGKVGPVVVGAGHAATAVLRATSLGFVKPSAIVAVAPTWGGPLPIVFGKSEKMEGRYALLRNTLRLPGIGWALYQYVLSSEKNIKMQYVTHVYGNKDNVTPAIISQRTKITKRDGARFAPASFLSGRLDPVSSRDEFLALFEAVGAMGVPICVLSAIKGPKRSKAEMEALEGAKGVTVFKKVNGALLPHEEYSGEVAKELEAFLSSL